VALTLRPNGKPRRRDRGFELRLIRLGHPRNCSFLLDLAELPVGIIALNMGWVGSAEGEKAAG
jgi:hypothetical protein